MIKKETDINIEGFELIAEAMKQQNKGAVVLSRITGISINPIYRILKGGNFLVETMNVICKELGLKFIIVKDESATPAVYKRKRKFNGIPVPKRKIKVPKKSK